MATLSCEGGDLASLNELLFVDFMHWRWKSYVIRVICFCCQKSLFNSGKSQEVLKG